MSNNKSFNMLNKILKTLACSIAGTSMMTLSSALMSKLARQDFREPEHLGTMVGRLSPLLSKNKSEAAGWAAHYAMGTVFAAVFVSLWDSKKVKCDFPHSLALGGFAGLVGSIIWKATFKLHPMPPKTNYNRFYLQRIPAHLVFTIFTMLAYQLILKMEQPQNEALQQAPATKKKHPAKR